MIWKHYRAGDEDKCRITIEYARRFHLPSVFGAWTVPLRRRLRCPNRPSFLRVNGRLTRHISDESRVLFDAEILFDTLKLDTIIC